MDCSKSLAPLSPGSWGGPPFLLQSCSRHRPGARRVPGRVLRASEHPQGGWVAPPRALAVAPGAGPGRLPWALGSASLISEADRRRGSRGGVHLTQSQRGQPLSVFPTSHQPLINNPQPLSREQPLWKPGSQERCQGQQSCCGAGRAPQAAPRRPQGPLGQPSAPRHLSLPRPFPRPRGWC